MMAITVDFDNDHEDSSDNNDDDIASLVETVSARLDVNIRIAPSNI